MGFAGYVLLSLGQALVVGVLFAQVFVLDPLGTDFHNAALAGGGLAAVISLLTAGLGALLFAIATLRAGIFPKWATALFAFGFVALSAAPVLPKLVATVCEVILSVGLVGLSWALISSAVQIEPRLAATGE